MTYKIRPGDTLSKIARNNGISMTQLLQANPQITDPNKIRVGDVITLPNGAIDLTTDTTKPLPPIPAPPPTTTPATPEPTTSSSSSSVGGALGEALAEALGELSAKYETGGRGPGTVSTGSGDPGGVSYGSYQMATKMGTVARFVAQAGFKWARDFQGLAPGTAPFTACWKRIATAETTAFQSAQHAFIKKSHYDLLAAKILNDDALDVNTRSRAVQDVVWSTAVQHGGGTPIFHRAIANCTAKPADANFDEQLIRAVYAERGRKKPDGNLAYFSKSSPSVQAGVAKRFKNEEVDALAMLAKKA
jgi:murein DD-endopeptidase MepM/ murein hydrolase activator NlpD